MSYIVTTPQIGVAGLNAVYTAAALGYPWVSATVNPLPSAAIEQMFGQIVSAQDSSSSTAGGGGEFIFLRVPTSTAITAGLFYGWTGAYDATVLAASVASQASSGKPIALAINTVASNASSLQGTWFQVQGRGTALKSSATSNVQPNVSLYVSSVTAGRVRTTASVFRTIIGLRSANQATVASTTSTLIVYLDRPKVGPGI